MKSQSYLTPLLLFRGSFTWMHLGTRFGPVKLNQCLRLSLSSCLATGYRVAQSKAQIY
jgi:hypothetical protein